MNIQPKVSLVKRLVRWIVGDSAKPYKPRFPLDPGIGPD